MSVSVGRNRIIVVGAAVALTLVIGAVVHTMDRSSPGSPAGDDTEVRQPTASVDIVRSTDPNRFSIEVSRRLYRSSNTAVLVDAKDQQAQRIAIASASALGVPVLLDDPAAPAELERLGARTVLTFGATHDVPRARTVPVDRTRAAEVVAEIRGTTAGPGKRHLDTIVVTRSRNDNAAAVASAVSAGAEVVEIPGADPRRDPAAAKILAARPRTPVVALGTAFADGFTYSLAVVRERATQASGGYLALGRHYTALYGHPGAPSLGVLGEQGVAASIARVKRLAKKYRAVSKAEFVPTFEIIATVASGGAGKDRDYSQEASIEKLTPLVDAAEEAGVYVILDLQPGRSDFLTQAKLYRRLLERPHVGLALDPEWRLKKGQKHLRQIGSVQAAEVNRVADWLADLTRRKVLPQKLFVLHQFSLSMIKHRDRLDTRHAELATVIHVDGSGSQGAKQGTWKTLRHDAPKGIGWGWKNFYDEDPRMLTVAQTWRRVRPHPDLITYQ
ncbi:hypothetical protein C6I20_15730 [Aeromicrobium sp. A1-2]|uniref:hypothetical protein n=1 Tax=Aeromicrobium sp. A1-2 TaxID=2107713 RepID=UPI000E53C41E|nr:hypothetical protein [Aeromicrobium sp. A1-2]AXT86480.1 hypothetical protein C6I20_15730 [Aeromicrobium sp. A1-2]